MRLKLTFFLILLNLGVFYIIYHLEKSDPETLALTSENIFGASISDIDYIEIGGQQYAHPFILEKQNNNWRITYPIDWPANLFSVQRIITQLQFIEPEISFSVKELQSSCQSLEDFGLDAPSVSIKFHSENHIHSLDIGKPTSSGNRIYVLSPDRENILVVKQCLLDSIEMNLENLRKQQIFNIPIFELNTLSVHFLAPHNFKIGLSKQYNQWRFEAPIQVRANSTLVNSAISQLSTINLKRFILDRPNSIDRYGLHNPFMRIALQSNNQSQTLLIGEQDRNETSGQFHFARLEDNNTVFTISTQPFLALRDAQEALREKHFIHFREEDLRDITISNTSHRTNLKRLEDNTWKILQNNHKGQLISSSSDTQTIEELLVSLKNLEAIEFVTDAPSSTDLKEFGFENPQLTIQLHGENTPTLVVGNLSQDSGYFYAKLNNAPYVYYVSPAFLKYISANPLHYKDRLLEHLPSQATIQSIKLFDLRSGTSIFDYSFQPKESSEKEALASEPVDNRQVITELIAQLKDVTVKDYIEADFEPKGTQEQPWCYRLEATVVLPGQESAKSIDYEYFLSERISGQKQLGGSPKHDLSFHLNQDWIDILAHYTKSTKPTPLPTEL